MSGLKRLVVEVHRRSLWQIVGIYLGGAWLAYEIIQGITEGRGLPEWLPALALVLLVLGLPFVVATAFVREEAPSASADSSSPEAKTAPVQDRGDARREAVGRRRVLTLRNAVASFVVALAVWGVVAAGWMVLGERTDGLEEERKSIAVLPLANMSADPDDEYFTDGIHDAIIGHLAKIADLKVTSRTSVMEYRNTTENVRRIAEELGVATVLEGGVQRAGDRVRIQTQLIDARTDEHLWAESYERELTAENVFAIQSDVARQIAAAMRATLTPEERERIDKQATEDVEAYDLYLRALDEGGASRDERIGWLDRAVELDPSFALAWAKSSQLHTAMFYQGIDRSGQRLEAARRAADRALELDPKLAEANLALASYYYLGVGDPNRGVAYAEEALRLDPSNAGALWQIARHNLVREGRAEEAKASFREVLALDPRSYERAWRVARGFQYFHDFEIAERYYDRAIALAPELRAARSWKALLYLSWVGDTAMARAAMHPEPCWGLTHSIFDSAWRLCTDPEYARGLAAERELLLSAERTSELGAAQYFILRAWLHGRRGEEQEESAAYDSARAILEVLVRARPDDGRLRSGLGVAYAGIGRANEAIAEGQRAMELESDPFHPQTSHIVSLARIYMMVGDPDRAIDQLETLPTDRGLVTPAWLGADPLWDPLHDHPRFQALLENH
jgi:TolB-like protein/Flp pilus assembly protein TadD